MPPFSHVYNKTSYLKNNEQNCCVFWEERELPLFAAFFEIKNL